MTCPPRTRGRPEAVTVDEPLVVPANYGRCVGEAAAVPSLQAVAARFVPADRRSLYWGCLTASLAAGSAVDARRVAGVAAARL